ncbi:MAG: tetratricopeptide repeat protein, partial [Planctomycetaceae bacterium]|nr:tetratricopeptide repeat protein [Planctomycetaceae bacterium]
MHSLQEQLEAAVRLHQSGDLAQAQPLYEQVLEQQATHPDALHLYGVLLHQRQQPQGAVEYIRRAIRLNPHSPLYHSNLAAALLETGNAAGAVSACRRALELDPRHVAAQANLGRACLQAGQLTEAACELQLAVQQQPHDALLWDCLIHALEQNGDRTAALKTAREATGLHAGQGGLYRRLARLLAQSGELEEARQQAEQATRLQPADAGSWLTLSNVLRELRRFDAAETACRQAVQLAPQLAFTHLSLAGILVELGRLSEAIDASHQGLELAGERPGLPSGLLSAGERADVWFTLGTACLGVERFDEAIDALQRAHQIQPAESRIRLNLGAALREAGQLQEGEQVLRSLVQDHPRQAEALVNLGAVLSELGRTEEAIACCEQAIALEPDSTWARLNLARQTVKTSDAARTLEAARRAVSPHSPEPAASFELGNLCREEGEPEQAVEAYSRAIAGNPAFAEARFNRSLALLSLGRLEEGWDEYEWRLGTQVPRRPSEVPLWTGEPLENRTILVQYEQGIGDEVMFSSCLPDLLKLAGHVMLECSPRLVPLLARSFPEITVLPVGGGGAENSAGESTGNRRPDCRIMAGSLPRFFRRSAALFPEHTGWLEADARSVARWQEQLHEGAAELVVGISWRGGKQPAARRLRSTALADWSPLLTDPRLRVISLQYGDCTAELAAAREAGLSIEQPEGIDPLAELDDYAALLCSLDLVISVDNATVHLAGALGCEVWTLLPRAADWRWQQTGETSPWYPSMRLFRQPAADDWGSVFSRVQSAVAERMPLRDFSSQPGRFDGPHGHQPLAAATNPPDRELVTAAAPAQNLAAAGWAGRGLRHSIEGSRQEAISCWETACRLEPHTGEYWHGLG